MRCSSWVGTKLLLQLLIKSPLPRGRTKEASPTHILSSLSPSPISRPTSGSRNQSPRTSWHTQRQYSASSSASCRRLDTAFVRHTCRTTSHQHHNTVLVLDRIRKEGGGKDSQLFLEGSIVLPLSFIYQVITTTNGWHWVNFWVFFLLISLHYIIICQYYIPKWNRMILKNLEKNFFQRVPPLKIFQNFEKCLFSMLFQNML